jgi:chemotaxis protein MotB
MAGQSNAAPVIIKRKKNIIAGGHHGGAWKVAYADFVTAMMAFFMLMWLLNATTEKQRKGLADYFNPTIPVNRISGGGDGAFGGDSVFSENTMAQNGTGAAAMQPTEANKARGESGSDADGAAQELAEAKADIEKMLSARGGESMTMQQALRHVVSKVTDEGLVIEIFDVEGAPLFQGNTATPNPVMDDIVTLLTDVLGLTTNGLALGGHVASFPITLIRDPSWDLSSARAQAVRDLLQVSGLPGSRFQRVSGHADRAPVTANPMAVRNNRLEVILLRRDR